MKIYETKEVPVIEETLVKIVCDVCEKEIFINNFHYKVETGHNEWGNDSYESLKELDACSDKCLNQLFELYLESSYKTKYINIEKRQDTI